jgi:hypothetical protein
MNCANHTNTSAVAYCRTCGKPLCLVCARDVRGVIYCENCLAARLEGHPASSDLPAASPFLPPAPPPYAQPSQSGPNPALAGILAGFFPVGVGAVYNGQYAKGLAHLVIFVLLIMGAGHGAGMATFCGLALGFYYVYQIIDAVRSARAIQMGQPAPDPFGLGQAFGAGAGEKLDVSKIPTAAVVLIAIGALFLLETLGLFSFDFDRIWPIFLILLGGWLFARNSGLGSDLSRGRARRHGQARLMLPAILVTFGVLSLLENTTRFGWDRTWPVLILVIGVLLLLRSGGFGGRPGTSSPGTPETGAVPGSSPGRDTESSQPPANEVKNV